MPRPPRGTEGFTAVLHGNTEAQEYILANYRGMALLDLSRETKVRYTVIAEFLRKRGLYANRHTVKRYNVRAFLKLSPLECAYLAGMIDGDGTISAQLFKGRYIRPIVNIHNTSFPLLQWAHERGFSGSLARNTLGRAYFRMSWTGYGVDQILIPLHPYLVIKGPQADLVLELITLHTQQRRTEPLTARMLEIVAEIHALNLPGSKLEAGLKRAGFSTSTLPKNNLLLQRE